MVAPLSVCILFFSRDTRDDKLRGLEPVAGAVCQRRVPREGTSKLDRKKACTRRRSWGRTL